MKKKYPIVVVAVLLCLGAAFSWAGEPAEAWMPKDYEIGAGDVLAISIWKDKALTRQMAVLPDGTISFPLVGRIKAAGKTVAQLKQEVEQRIKRYMPNPVLNVSVLQVNSMIVYVIGRVKGPGRFPVHTNVNVLQALAMAGGLDRFAKRNKIKVFRERDDQTKIFNFKYDEVVDGERLEQNMRLKRGDVVVVP